ncbi:MAG: hypothetical protein EHM61_04320 [Acidobacteria bacterium]|nr:MAG: hypothetical protein EHM61_04320 [Acidobacteriota bacterium]
MSKRLGLSMRVDQLHGRAEQHDCLAHDWPAVLYRALGDITWFPLPNLGERTEAQLDALCLEAVILTGGNSIGQSPVRDDSERRMLDFCYRRNLPVLGVCRGLQLIHYFLTGILPERVCAQVHAGRSHPVQAPTELGRHLLAGRSEVSSYHEWGIFAEKLQPELEIWALSGDGVVEGFVNTRRRTIASQWHPERGPEAADAGLSLIRYFYNEL